MHLHTEDRCFPLGVLAWEAFWKATLLHARWHQRKKKKKSGKGFNGEELDFNLGCHQVYPCASPPHLGGRTRRDEEGACVGNGQTKSDREGKLQGTVSLHPHLEQGGMSPVKKKKKARL